MKAKSRHVVYVKKRSKSKKDVTEIYRILNYKDRPFWQEKIRVTRKRETNRRKS
jgi:hypothetical protein